MEAPPAVITTNLGESMTNYLEKFMEGDTSAYQPTGKNLSTVIPKAWSRLSLSAVGSSGLLGRQGVDAIGSITIPAEDRNRTSPFPYGGGRFEFRKSAALLPPSLTISRGVERGWWLRQAPRAPRRTPR